MKNMVTLVYQSDLICIFVFCQVGAIISINIFEITLKISSK